MRTALRKSKRLRRFLSQLVIQIEAKAAYHGRIWYTPVRVGVFLGSILPRRVRVISAVGKKGVHRVTEGEVPS